MTIIQPRRNHRFFTIFFTLTVVILAGGYMAIVQNVRSPLILFAAIGSAITAGIFFAFSTFVMQALARQAPAAGIAAMQAINVTVINPWFMVTFFGPGLVGLMLMLATFRHLGQPAALYWLAGTVLYVVGTIGVTIAGNVPLNDALAEVNPHSAAGATLWIKYLTDWTLWNHVRTIAAALAAVLFTLSRG